MADDKNVRHRFTVPSADDVVNDWIENQSNLGFSLRVLIRAFVRQYGNKDATCVEFGEAVAKRGRPRNQDLIRLGQMASTNEEYDDDEQYVEEPVQTVSEPKKSRPVKSEVVEPVIESVVEEVVVQPVQQVQAQMPVQNDSSDIMSLFSAGSTMNRGNKSEKPVVSNMSSQSKGMSVNEDGFLDID